MKSKFSTNGWQRGGKLGVTFFVFALLAFLLANCAPTATPTTPPAGIVGPVWKWRSSQFNSGAQQQVPDPNLYTVEFTADRQVHVKADCNTGGGTYTVNGNQLTISALRMTLVACPPGSLDFVYLQQLQAVGSYLISGSEMVLNIQDNTGRMIFTSEAVTPQPTDSPATETAEAVITPATPIAQTVTPLPYTPTGAPYTPTAVTLTPTGVPYTATPAKTASCAGAPTIEFFRSEPANMYAGQNAVLRWGKVTNATSVAIDQGIGGVASPGSTIVSPATSTAYTLTATGCGGTAQAVVHLVINAPTGAPPTVAPTQVPPTNIAPTNVPPTNVPPTEIPPTEAPPTEIPPTEAPPTAVPPTEEPPTQAPPPTVKPGADLIGVTWRWTGLIVATGNENPPDPAKYTILFNSDGSLSVQADCNHGTGSYTLSGNSLTIQLGVMTTAHCSDDSLSSTYLALLPQASSYSVQGSTLSIVLNGNNGTMTFTR